MLQTNPEELVANTFRIVEYPGQVIQHLAITYGHLDMLIHNTVKKTLYYYVKLYWARSNQKIKYKKKKLKIYKHKELKPKRDG